MTPDKIKETLSPSDRQIGWHRYMIFSVLNGFSFGLLAENVLVLFALKAGVPEYIAGVLPAFMFLGMPFMLAGKMIIKRAGAAKTIATGWGTRNTSALLMAMAPFLYIFGAGNAVVFTIVACAFGFYSARAVGVVAFRPLVGEITTEADRGKFLGAMGMRFNGSYVLALALLALVMKISPSLAVFQILIATGCFAGLASAWVVAKVPETTTPQESAQEPIIGSVINFWKNRRLRKLLFAQGAGWALFAMVVPFSLVALKAGYGVSDFEAILFILVQVTGSMVIAMIFGLLADKTGPRPLLILYGSGFLLIALMWIVIPTSFLLFSAVIIFFLGGACKAGTFQGLNHYFLRSTSGGERVMAGMIVQMLGGASAGFAGCIISGGLLKILGGMEWEPLQIYRLYFAVIAVIALPLIWCLFRLEPIRDWEVKDVLSLIASPRDWWALHNLFKLERSISPGNTKKRVEKLANIKSSLSQDALKELLDSPDFSIRSRALAALRNIKLKKSVQEALIRELKENIFTTAYIAAEILGEQKVREAVPALRRSLNSEDVYLQGKSMVALVQLEDSESYDSIRRLFLTSTNPRTVIHGAMALSQMDDINELQHLLPRAAEAQLPERVRHEILQRCADLTGCAEIFYTFHKTYNSDREQALHYLREYLTKSYVKYLDMYCAEKISEEEVLKKIAEGEKINDDAGKNAVNNTLNRSEAEKIFYAEFVFATLLFCNIRAI